MDGENDSHGVTLFEVLAALVLTTIVMVSVLTAVWQIALRVQRLTTANEAVEGILTANHALQVICSRASYTQIVYSGDPSKNTGVYTLWMYQGGYPYSDVVNPAQPWLYQTTQIQSNTVSSGISNAKCFYVFQFQQNPRTGLWNIYGSPATSPSQTLNFSGRALASNVNVEWYLPQISSWGGGGWFSQMLAFFGIHPTCSSQQSIGTSVIPSGTVVNSFILKLYTTYRAPSGQMMTYSLTAGYHDATVR